MKSLLLLVVSVALAVFLIYRSAGAMSTIIYQTDLRVSLRDSGGRPISGIELEVWEYDQQSRRAVTNAEGVALFRVSYQKTGWGSIGNQQNPVRLRFLPGTRKGEPERFFPLYYRFEVKGDGDCGYNVFVRDYDYWFGGNWAGTFFGSSRKNAPEFSHTDADASGRKTYQAVAPRRPGHYEEKPTRWADGDLLPGVDGFECRAKVVVGEDRKLSIDLDLAHTGKIAVTAR